MIFPILFLGVLAVATGDNNADMLKEDESGNSLNDDNDAVAFESFGSPTYGPLLGGKSAYNYPVPPASLISSSPAGYAAYLANLGLSNPYAYGAYNRYTSLPTSVQSLLGYGLPFQNALGYGYSTLLSKYGGYGSPYYPIDRTGYPLSSLGYRYGGAGYVPQSIKGAPVTAVVARGAPVARYSTPPPGFPAALAPYPVPASLPVSPVPAPVYSPYRSAVRATQSKDGSVRYTYVPSDVPSLPVY